MTRLVLHGLGAFKATLDAVDLTAFSTDKVRALLIYLALETAQPHRRELLASLFWPEMPQSTALTNLRLALHRLRQTFDEVVPDASATLLISTRQTLQLNAAFVTVDVASFQTLLAACAGHGHQALHTCDECLARLAQAVELYQGELLAGFGVKDAPAFEEWLLLRRETLHQQVLASLHRLVEAYEQRDDLQAHHYARRQLLLEPSREESHRQLMRILARRGLYSEALAQYESCRRLLYAELGVEPTAETKALYQQIRDGKLDQVHNDALLPPPPIASFRYDWSEAPEPVNVYGRQVELAYLERWLVHERCRLIVIVGMGGVGKTTLAAAAVEKVGAQFDRVIWRSLVNALPLGELVVAILERLSGQRVIDLPTSLEAQLVLLLDYLRQQRCLLVLDNLESILQADQTDRLRAGYAGYAQLFQYLAERGHQSCLLLTSRERPHGMVRWGEDTPLVRTLALEGLDDVAAQAMLNARDLIGAAGDVITLVQRYSGNPLALTLVAHTVQDVFGGDIASFLATEAPIFDDIREVLDQQFARLSALEQEILIWLAIEREPIASQSLRDNLVYSGPPRAFIEALRALQRRSLVGQSVEGFFLQNVVMEYTTDLLVDQVCEEIRAHTDYLPARIVHSTLNHYALLKATAKAYVRASQTRLLVQPIVTRLEASLGKQGLVKQINAILATLHAYNRAGQAAPQGYAAGNLLNLLRYLGVDLRGYDFSGLAVHQAYLQGSSLPDVNFANADLAHSVFTHSFGEILAIQFDTTQRMLVAGSVEGKLYVWSIVDGQVLHEYHTLGIGAHLAHFSPDGRLLASGHTDHQVRLWEVANGNPLAGGRLLHTLSIRMETQWCLVFSPDGKKLAVGGADGVVHLYDVWRSLGGNQTPQTFQGHRAAIPALAFTSDSQLLASGDVDGYICLWRLSEYSQPGLRQTFRGHTDEVHRLTFDATNTMLASGSHDRTIRLWPIGSDDGTFPTHADMQPRHTLYAHTQAIRTLAMSPDGITLASGGNDAYIRLWDIHTGQLLHTFLEIDHPSAFLSFSADGRLLASAGRDQIVYLWDVGTRQRLSALQAYNNLTYAVGFSPDGQLLTSGGTDGLMRLWDVSMALTAGGQEGVPLVRAFQGHPRSIRTLDFHPHTKSGHTIVASAGDDQVIRVWDIVGIKTAEHGRTVHLVSGHTDNVEAIQFSPDGQRLVSASRDKTVKVWDVSTLRNPGRQGVQLIHTLHGHTDRVHSCAFSPTGQQIASGSIDRTVCLWDAQSGSLLHTLYGHTNAVRSVTFSRDGSILASSSYDHVIRFWDTQTGTLLDTLSTWETAILAMDFHPQLDWLALGANDHTLRLWDRQNKRLLTILRGHTNSVEALEFSPDGRLLVSASTDETLKLWDVATWVCLQTLRADGPYARMNISGVTGISAAQKAALSALGAIERRLR